MKKEILLVLVGFMAISCASSSLSFKATHEDTAIFAELLLNDTDWVILKVRNNSTSQIQLLADKAYYSNFGTGENTILVPFQENMNPDTKVLPIPISAGRIIIQKFVAPAYIEYKRGKVENINNWTPIGKDDIKTAIFSFEYEIEGERKLFNFEQFISSKE